MEHEIDFNEILRVLRRGKYWIIGITVLFTLAAIFYVFFMATPTYRHSAVLDLTSYTVASKEVQALIESKAVITGAVKDLAVAPGRLARSAEINYLHDKEPLLQIKVEHDDPDTCVEAVKEIGLGVIETVSAYRLKQTNLEIERKEKLMAHLEETIEDYLRTRDQHITDLLEEDPVYKLLLEEKAATLVSIKALNFDLEKMSEKPSQNENIWLSGPDQAPQAVAVNKKAYIAVALLLGLMVSVLTLFAYHFYFTGDPRRAPGK